MKNIQSLILSALAVATVLANDPHASESGLFILNKYNFD